MNYQIFGIKSLGFTILALSSVARITKPFFSAIAAVTESSEMNRAAPYTF